MDGLLQAHRSSSQFVGKEKLRQEVEIAVRQVVVSVEFDGMDHL